MAKSQRPQFTCYCSAYPFPHRAGGGKCKCRGEETLCSGCGEPNSGTFMDMGIGAYEYWGVPSFDKNIQWLSTCCEAALNRNDGSGQQAAPPEPDYD